jgi:hypothetical protein
MVDRDSSSDGKSVSELNVPLERDVFLRTLIRELSGTLEDVIGVEDAYGFISVVGQNVGDWLGEEYRSALSVSKLSREQVAEVMVDLKARIEGDLYIMEQDDEKIVLGNRA